MKKSILYIIFIIALCAIYYFILPIFKVTTLDEKSPISQNQVISYSVTGYGGHFATGTLKVLDSLGKKIIRYENFKTVNGPDLYVYLSKDLEAKEFIDIGRIKATEGNINYELPENVDLKEYHYVMTWCKEFGVLFNYVDLN